MISSLALSLLIAEWAFAAIRQDAFPFLNIFVADETFGVKLEPDTHTKLRSYEGRVVSVSSNSRGFRISNYKANASTRILLLGDSQMFGYNVAERDSTSGALNAAGISVFNAAIPSWGPPEYVEVLIHLLTRLKPTHVVFTANVANDWFEVYVPNRERTTAQDGWATPLRVAQSGTRRNFPGRRLLFNQSHLAFATKSLISGVGNVLKPRSAPIFELLSGNEELNRVESDRYASRLTPFVLRAQKLCDEAGATLIATALPLDVQVHRAEWTKYHTEPRNMDATNVLAERFISDMRRERVPALNLLEPLVRNSPGAFLPDDYHLSPKGHRVVAEAIQSCVTSRCAGSES